MSKGSRPFRLVVEGVGDVVRLFYSPALEKLKEDLAKQNRKVFVIFVDASEFWRNNPDLRQKISHVIQSVRNWGAAYLDKSDSNDFKKYKALTADAVFIATPDFTHCEIAEGWLGPPRRCHQIFIEKPLDRDLNATRRLLGKLKAYDDSVLAFDHYRARMLPTKISLNIILGFLEKRLKSFTFYFLEDHSGNDTKYIDALTKQGLTNRNGPIENERRVGAMKEGLILDMMPHIPAILEFFGYVETIRVTHVRAGQYVGVDNIPSKRTEIDKETFAEVNFCFHDYDNNLVEKGTAFVGKGIGGVRGVKAASPVKILDVEGENGNRVRFDFSNALGQLMDKKGKIEHSFKLGNIVYPIVKTEISVI